MSETALFWPAFAQVVLIVAVMLLLGRRRASSMRDRRQTYDDVALNRATDWDEPATKAANNYRNQFEMPMLFLAALAFAVALRMTDVVMVVLAWVFVASRAVHAAIHLTVNRTLPRAAVWLLGVATVVMMWLVLAARVANTGAT